MVSNVIDISLYRGITIFGGGDWLVELVERFKPLQRYFEVLGRGDTFVA